MRLRTARDIGALIRDRRRARNWDQQTLAERIGVSRLWIGAVENGKPTVRLDLVLRALSALDIDLNVGDAPTMTGGSGKSADLIQQLLKDRGR